MRQEQEGENQIQYFVGDVFPYRTGAPVIMLLRPKIVSIHETNFVLHYDSFPEPREETHKPEEFVGLSIRQNDKGRLFLNARVKFSGVGCPFAI